MDTKFPKDLPFIVLKEFPDTDSPQQDQTRVLALATTGWYGEVSVDRNFLEDCHSIIKKFPKIVGIPSFSQTSKGLLGGVLSITLKQKEDLDKFTERYESNRGRIVAILYPGLPAGEDGPIHQIARDGLTLLSGSEQPIGTIVRIPALESRITKHIREVLAHNFLQTAVPERSTGSGFDYWKTLRKMDPTFPDPMRSQ